MQAIDRNGDLYKRYVKKLTDQEDEFEKLNSSLRETEQQIGTARKNLEAYLAELTLE